MIDTKELRLGNLFQDEDETPCYFAGAWERKEGWIYRDSGGNTYKEMQMYPIVLTTEILKKCGFKEMINDIEWDLPDNSFYIVRSYGTDYFRHSHTPLKYLHQLQNLYYALIQKELKIKLWI